MFIRIFLILFFYSLLPSLFAQGSGTPMVVQEEIYFEPISDSQNTLFHLLIEPINNKQDIYMREYFIEPDSIIFRDGKYFATWNLNPSDKAIDIKVLTVVQKLGRSESIFYERKKKNTFIETGGKTFNRRVTRNSASIWDLAIENYKNQESEDAIILFDMLIEMNPEKHDSYIFKGVSLARLGEFEEAMFQLEAAEQLAEMEFDKGHVIYAKANVYALMGDKVKCIATLNEAVDNGFHKYISVLLSDPDFSEIITREEAFEFMSRAREIEHVASFK